MQILYGNEEFEAHSAWPHIPYECIELILSIRLLVIEVRSRMSVRVAAVGGLGQRTAGILIWV
jgi:hypothetical protein